METSEFASFMDTRAVICGAILAAAWAAPAYALRPFVGTDAAVAAPGELELELGYLSYLREGGQKSVIAPAAVVILGLQHGNELVLEGGVRTRLNPEADIPRTTFEDAAISLKHVHRAGVLQDAEGPSIASECGVLIPTLQGERTGASCAGIVSVRWGETAVHFNGAIGKNREAIGKSSSERLLQVPALVRRGRCLKRSLSETLPDSPPIRPW